MRLGSVGVADAPSPVTGLGRRLPLGSTPELASAFLESQWTVLLSEMIYLPLRGKR
jgi:hypothetical protein